MKNYYDPTHVHDYLEDGIALKNYLASDLRVLKIKILVCM